jgi:hypothetical protein
VDTKEGIGENVKETEGLLQYEEHVFFRSGSLDIPHRPLSLCIADKNL